MWVGGVCGWSNQDLQHVHGVGVVEVSEYSDLPEDAPGIRFGGEHINDLFDSNLLAPMLYGRASMRARLSKASPHLEIFADTPPLQNHEHAPACPLRTRRNRTSPACVSQ